MDSIVARRPDIIEAYMRMTQILANEDLPSAIMRGRAKMNLELLANVDFWRDYSVISNAPYREFNRVLFIRTEVAQPLVGRGDIEILSIAPLVAAYDQISSTDAVCAAAPAIEACTDKTQ